MTLKALIQLVLLVLLILTGTVRVEYMALLAFCNGVAETFAQPIQALNVYPGCAGDPKIAVRPIGGGFSHPIEDSPMAIT